MTEFSSILILMMLQGILGAIDTVYYHEYVYNLPGHSIQARPELKLHAIRDFLYGTLYLSVPFVAWSGLFAYVLGFIFTMEILITLVDFAIEDTVRIPWGGVAKGERTMHTVIALLYGAFSALIFPHLQAWSILPTGFQPHQLALDWQKIIFPLMGVVAIGSGIRDWGAQAGLKLCQRSLFKSSQRKVLK